MTLNGYFIQYKFILPSSTKHSSYSYQKLFRALYGYTQNVTKSSGKTYHYHRKGVLSEVPYMRPGKNCVIIPQSAFNQLVNFFKTGKNPSHYWRGKGDWKAVYYMNEKAVSEKDAADALEQMLERSYVLTTSKEHEKIQPEISVALSKTKSGIKADDSYKKILIAEAEKIVNGPWFKECQAKSQKLEAFSRAAKELKGT